MSFLYLYKNLLIFLQSTFLLNANSFVAFSKCYKLMIFLNHIENNEKTS